MDLDWVAHVARGSGSGGKARRGSRLQSLWGGYGEIVRVAIEGGDVDSVIVKNVKPPVQRVLEDVARRLRRA